MLETNTKEKDVESAELEKLKANLELKSIKLDSLLQLTQAINYNFSTASLLDIFNYIVSDQLKLGSYLLYLRAEDGWLAKVSKGNESTVFPSNPEPYLLQVSNSSALSAKVKTTYPNYQWVVPVLHKNIALCYLLLENKLEKDLVDYVQTITNILAVAHENKKLFKDKIKQEKIKNELSLAAKMQGLLIPSKLPDTNYLQADAVYIPHHDVGGDYYDYIQVNENEIYFIVADVSGKGIPAALIMSNLQANFRAIVSHHSELTDIAKELNKSILSITHGDQFVTAFICRILIAENKLQYLNAGHIPPLVSHNEDCFYLKKGTTILGVFNALPELEFGEMDIEPGMKLLVFTDGVNEVSDYRNKTFEALGIEKVLMSLPDGSASLINKALLESINRFKGDTEYKDDITILTVVFKG